MIYVSIMTLQDCFMISITVAENEREADGKQRYNVDVVDRCCRAQYAGESFIFSVTLFS